MRERTDDAALKASSGGARQGRGPPAAAPGLARQPGGGSSTKTFRAVSEDELFAGADAVGLHYVLSGRELGLMRRSALLVNTSRGGIPRGGDGRV